MLFEKHEKTWIFEKFYVDICFLKILKSWNFYGFSYTFYVDPLLFEKKILCRYMLFGSCFLKKILCRYMLFGKKILCRYMLFGWRFYVDICFLESCFLKKILCRYMLFENFFLIFLLSGRSTPPLCTWKIISLTHLLYTYWIITP